MNYQVPRAVTGRLLNASGRSDSLKPVPTEFSGEVLFDGGVSASYYCSFLTEHQQFAHLSGTKEIGPDRRLRFAFLRKPDRAHRVQCKLRLRRLRLPHGLAGTLKSRPRNIRAVIRPPRVQAFPNLFRSCSRRATGFPLAGGHPSHPADSHGLPGVCPKGRERSFPGLKRSLGRSPTSVHGEHRSGDVTGGIGGEKDGRSLNFPQFSPTLEGGCAHDELHAVFGVGD